MNVFWTLEAQQDRADIWDYIAADNPRAAATMDALFSDAAAVLTEHRKIGREGKISGTRELVPHKTTAWFIESRTIPSGFCCGCTARGSGLRRHDNAAP